jgi:NADH-quinone oxidoreductase subunit L
MERLIVLVAALPLVSALLLQLQTSRSGWRAARLSVTFSAVTFALAIGLLWFTLGDREAMTVGFDDFPASLLLDPLSALMALVIGGISLIVHVYSVRYMAEEPGYVRFFVLLDLMTAALLVMVAAGDLITLLIAWHLIGVLLYFLLGQDTRSPSAWRYAFWTLLTYRIGDLPLVLAAGLLYHAYGTWSLSEIFERLMADPGAHSVLGLPLPEVVGGLIALAAFARSAQFLLHTWLPYTMDGPTPVSALMHAGIVNAGGFLINRFAPVFVNTSEVLHWVFVVGLITAVIGSVLMLTQNDIKKSLGYSTMGQMGFMIMECGVGAFSLAIYHLIAHGLFKGTLFLGAGGVINAARRDDGVPKDDLYTFVVERRPARQRQPWLLMAAITLAVPISILILAHWLVSQDYFQKQGAIVLLFFGWITGVQVLFATHRLDATNPVRMMLMILLSFALIVIGYSIIGHTFETFLYPDAAFREALYHAAGLDAVTFDMLVVLLGLIVLVGWIGSYLASREESLFGNRFTELRLTLYSLISRELYIADLYERLSQALLEGSKRINVWMRWR